MAILFLKSNIKYKLCDDRMHDSGFKFKTVKMKLEFFVRRLVFRDAFRIVICLLRYIFKE